MKKLILILSLFLATTGFTQEYWADYLPDVSGWPDYYNENLYWIDTSQAPTVIKIDPTGTDPEATHTTLANIQNFDADDSYTIIVWKAGTSDTLDVYHQIFFKQNCHDVYLGTYGEGEKAKVRTGFDTPLQDLAKAGIGIQSGAKRIWVDNLDLRGGEPILSFIANPIPTWPYGDNFYRPKNGFYSLISIEGAGGSWQDKVILTRLDVKAGEFITGSHDQSEGIDTLVLYDNFTDTIYHEGIATDVVNFRAYNNRMIGVSNFAWFFNDDTELGWNEKKTGGDGIQLSLGYGSVNKSRGRGTFFFYYNNIWRHQTALKHTIFFTGDQNPPPGYDLLGSVAVFYGNNITAPKDSIFENHRGDAYLTTNPGTPTYNDYYVAKACGDYTYFGVSVPCGENYFLWYNGSSWEVIHEDIFAYGQVGGSNMMGFWRIDSVYLLNNKFWGGPDVDGIHDKGGPFGGGLNKALRWVYMENNVFHGTACSYAWTPTSVGYPPGTSASNYIYRFTSRNNLFVNAKTNVNTYWHWLSDIYPGATGGQIKTSQNDIYLLNDPWYTALWHPSFPIDTLNCILQFGDSATWDARYGITDWYNEDFTPTVGGRLHNNGISVTPLRKYNGYLNNSLDYEGNTRIYGGSVDIGPVEYIGEGPVQYPLIVNGGTGSGNYEAGETVSISATIPPNFEFVRWQETGSQIANINAASTTLIMPASSYTVTAIIQEIPNVGVIYIDPTHTGFENGSIGFPYNSWADVHPLQSNTTYLQKRGTTALLTDVSGLEGYTEYGIGIHNVTNVYIGAYGTGSRPILQCNNNEPSQHIVGSETTGSVTIEGLFFTSYDAWNDFETHIRINHSGAVASGKVEIKDCEFTHGNYAAILPGGQLDSLIVEDCIIHNVGQEGIWGGCKNAVIRGNHLYDINMKYWWVGKDETSAGGDAIQLGPGDQVNGGHLLIENNIIDRRSTGNKFCLIISGVAPQPNYRGDNFRVTFRYNTVYSPIEPYTNSNGGGALYVEGVDDFVAYGNYFSGRGYDTDYGRPTFLGYVMVNHRDFFYYNVFDSVGQLALREDDNWAAGYPNDQHSEFHNNIFIGVPTNFAYCVFFEEEPGFSRTVNMTNNLFGHPAGLAFGSVASEGTFLTNSNNLYSVGSSTNWNNQLGITNWQAGDFTPIEGGAAHNTGYDYVNPTILGTLYDRDIDSVLVPIDRRDIGAYENVGACDPPAAPVALSADQKTHNSFRARWNASTGATGYYLTVYTTYPGAILTGWDERPVGNVTSYTVTGLSPETTYYYEVTASNFCGTSDPSNMVPAITLAQPPDAPDPPVMLPGALVTSSSFLARWTKSTGAERYRFYVALTRDTNNCIGGFPVNLGDVAEYDVTALDQLTTYHYAAIAIDDNTQLQSTLSNWVSVTTLQGVPGDFIAFEETSVTPTSFTANWGASVGADGYYMDLSYYSNFSTLITGYDKRFLVNEPGRSAPISGMLPDTTVYYRLWSRNEAGYSENPTNTITVVLPPEPIDAPTAHECTNVGYYGFTFHWESDIGGYYYDIGLDASFTNYLVENTYTTDTFAVITGANHGTTYYCRVRAYDGEQYSGYSGTIVVTTTLYVPPEPANLVHYNGILLNYDGKLAKYPKNLPGQGYENYRYIDLARENIQYVNSQLTQAIINDVNSMSAGAWIKPESRIGDAYIFQRQASGAVPFWYVRINTDGTVRVAMYDGTDYVFINSPGTITLNTWHFVAMTVDRQNQLLKLYIDGSLKGTADITLVGSCWSYTPLLIGDHRITGYGLDGGLDNAFVTRQILTLADMQTIYTSGPQGADISAYGPVILYEFEEGAGNTTVNLGSWGGGAILVNNPLWRAH